MNETNNNNGSSKVSSKKSYIIMGAIGVGVFILYVVFGRGRETAMTQLNNKTTTTHVVIKPTGTNSQVTNIGSDDMIASPEGVEINTAEILENKEYNGELDGSYMTVTSKHYRAKENWKGKMTHRGVKYTITVTGTQSIKCHLWLFAGTTGNSFTFPISTVILEPGTTVWNCKGPDSSGIFKWPSGTWRLAFIHPTGHVVYSISDVQDIGKKSDYDRRRQMNSVNWHAASSKGAVTYWHGTDVSPEVFKQRIDDKAPYGFYPGTSLPIIPLSVSVGCISSSGSATLTISSNMPTGYNAYVTLLAKARSGKIYLMRTVWIEINSPQVITVVSSNTLLAGDYQLPPGYYDLFVCSTYNNVVVESAEFHIN
jgi:hypothetical protein